MTLAEIEAVAQDKDAAELEAHRRFDALRAQGIAHDQLIESPEFAAWMAARHETDEAWGRWSMAMEAAGA